MNYIAAVYEGNPCKVYLFKSWGTYSHPVKPIGPLAVEDGLSRDGFYRAWMCTKHNNDQFVYFEGVETNIQPTDIAKPIDNKTEIKVYEPVLKGKQYTCGKELPISEILKFEVFLISLPNKSKTLYLLKPKQATSFTYKYDNEGRLKQVLVKDFDGNTTSLDY